MIEQPPMTIPHIKAGSYMDEQVDQFDAFAITWNDQDAIHLTFGRTSINVKNSVYLTKNGVTDREPGDIDVFRLDVGAVTMPIETARDLAETLNRMIAQAEARRAQGEQ
ncbi:hypothetical protein HBN70_06555 [Pseudomonas lundensis]|uniref:hypothetical protein n=1 Tax=Pseudomonas lundensis TaxID=86185 RepID=UPI001475DBAA|nr:hypothetical protein [Pseudomonas lundensis]NNA20425.1 hypothetical protein [Pseudomonas lundensis]